MKIERETRVDQDEGKAEVERERARMRRAYERDGNWIPGSVDD